MALPDSPTETKVVIDGEDVTDLVQMYDITQRFNDAISDGTIVFTPEIRTRFGGNEEISGKTVTVQRGINSPTEEYEFRGFTDVVETRGRDIEVEILDKMVVTKRKYITTSFDKDIDPESGVISEIYKDLLDQYTDLNYDSSTIQDSGQTITLEKFICRDSNLYERLQDLAEALNWQHYYNPRDDKVYFEPKGFQTSSVTFTVGDNLPNVPNWTIDKSRLANNVTVKGATQAVQKTVFDDGNGNQGQQIPLEFQPTSVKVYVGSGSFDPDGSPPTKPSDNENNLLSGGKQSVTAGTFDYEYDATQDVKTVFFSDGTGQPSFTPPSGTNNIEIQYTYDLPTPLTGKDQASIDRWGEHQKVITKSDIQTVNDAEAYLQKYLEYFSTPFVTTETTVTGEFGLIPGRVHRAVDDVNDIDRQLLLTKNKVTYPYEGDEITIGDEIWRKQSFEVNVWDRLKRLEEEQNKSGDLLVQVFDLGADIDYENRYFELQKTNVAGESGIYGNNTYGIYGSSKYGNTTSASFILGSNQFGILGTSPLGDQTSSPTTTRLAPGNDTFKEFVYDEEFYDPSASSVSSFDTANEVVTLDAGDIFITSNVAVNIPYTKARIQLKGNIDFNNLDVKITYNGGNDFLTLGSNGNTLSFPQEAAEIYLKITNTSTNPSGAEFPIEFPMTFTDNSEKLATQTDSFERRTAPAIQVDFFR